MGWWKADESVAALRLLVGNKKILFQIRVWGRLPPPRTEGKGEVQGSSKWVFTGSQNQGDWMNYIMPSGMEATGPQLNSSKNLRNTEKCRKEDRASTTDHTVSEYWQRTCSYMDIVFQVRENWDPRYGWSWAYVGKRKSKVGKVCMVCHHLPNNTQTFADTCLV